MFLYNLMMDGTMRRLFLLWPLMAIFLSGCFLTKVVSVPMRVVGAVVSVVPVVGEGMDDAVDAAASTIDKVPL